MALENDWAAGQVLTAAFFDSLVSQVNTNTDDIANRVELDGSNFTDDGAALLAALAVSKVKVQTAGILTVGLFFGATTPDDTVADSTDTALWFIPAGS